MLLRAARTMFFVFWQVLRLSKAHFGSPGLPAGLVACARLAVLAIDGAAVDAVSLADPARRRPIQPLRELPEGPYLLRLTRSGSQFMLRTPRDSHLARGFNRP